MLTVLFWLVIVPCLLLGSWIWGARVGSLQAAYVLVVSMMLADILLLRFHKVPFASGLPAGGNHIILVIFIYVFGFFVFTNGAATLESWILFQPTLFVAVPILWCGGRSLWAKWQRDADEEDDELVFESKTRKTVQTLDLEGSE